MEEKVLKKSKNGLAMVTLFILLFTQLSYSKQLLSVRLWLNRQRLKPDG